MHDWACVCVCVASLSFSGTGVTLMSLRRCFRAPLRARLCCILYKTLLHSHERHREQLQISVVCKRHLPSSIQTPPTSRKRNRLRNNVCSLRKIIQRTFSYDYYVQLTPSTCRVNTNANFDDVIRISGFFSVVCRCSVSLPSSYRSIWDVLGDLKKKNSFYDVRQQNLEEKKPNNIWAY